MPNIGPMELVIILIIALVVFGPKRLPELGRSLGSGMREFKDSVAGKGGGADKGEGRRANRTRPAELPSAAEAVPGEQSSSAGESEAAELDDAVVGPSS